MPSGAVKGSLYSITLRIIGNDDIGIVNNLTSIISKDEKLTLRSISIDSNDGLFRGNLVVMIDDTSRMEALIRKLRTVKGLNRWREYKLTRICIQFNIEIYFEDGVT